jgi:hypothetical protein
MGIVEISPWIFNGHFAGVLNVRFSSATEYGLEVRVSITCRGKMFFVFFSIASISALFSTQPPVK